LRFGNDYQAFITMRDRFPGFISYLPDTFDSIRSGIPAALRAVQECPERKAGIRFDSEDRIKNHYFYTITECLRLDLSPQLILESGWNLEKTIMFEKFRQAMEWPEKLQSYGFGGYLVEPPWKSPRRDDVAAVWKLTQSGSVATMKFGDEAGSSKQSIPGLPVIFRPMPLVSRCCYSDFPIGIIGQKGEFIPNYYCLSENNTYLDTYEIPTLSENSIIKYSPATQTLIDRCIANRKDNFQSI